MKQYLAYCFISAVIIYLLISLVVRTLNFWQWMEYTRVGFLVVMLVVCFVGYFLKQLNDDSDKF